MDEDVNEQALFASIEHSPIATVITNPRLRDNPVVAVNRAFCVLTGYPKERVLGKNCRFLAGAETDEAGRSVLRDAVAAARPALAEILNYRADGRPFHNAVMIAPLFAPSGELAYFLGSQVDVSDTTTVPLVRRQRAESLAKRLTLRQRQVLKQMALGKRNKQIGPQLGISEKTVKMHRARLIARLGVTTTADAVRIAVEAGI